MFNGETVSIPACFARHVVTLHGLVAREDVLEAARQHMVNTRLAICRRWTFIETELRTTLGLLERLLKNVMLAPKIQHLFFEVWSVVSTLYFFK